MLINLQTATLLTTVGGDTATWVFPDLIFYFSGCVRRIEEKSLLIQICILLAAMLLLWTYFSTQYQTVGGALATKTVLSTITLPRPSTIISTTTAPGSTSTTFQTPAGDNGASQSASISSISTSQTPAAKTSASQSNSVTGPARTTTSGVVLATSPTSSSASSSFQSINGCIGLIILAVTMVFGVSI